MVEIKTDQKKNGDFELMTKKLEESHLKCCLLENQLVTYKLNEKQSSNKIHKLTEEKEQAIKYAEEYKNKLGEFEFKFKEYQDEKNNQIEKLQSDLSEKLKSQIQKKNISCIIQVRNKRLELTLQEKEAEKNFLKEQLKISKEENEIITVNFENFIKAQNIRIEENAIKVKDLKKLKQKFEISQNNNKSLKASLNENTLKIGLLEENYEKKIKILETSLEKKSSKIKILDNKIKSYEKDMVSFQTKLTTEYDLNKSLLKDYDNNLKMKNETISSFFNKIKKLESEFNAIKEINATS